MTELPELSGQRVLVVGLGASGCSAVRFCVARGARVVAADERLDEAPELPASAELRLGALPDPADFDLVVPSPGVPPERYAERARRVWGDIELAGRALPVPIVAVTGTNGKSTTTLLVAHLLRAAGVRAEAAGNLGEPALELIGRPLDVAVLEVSSFQLESVECFRPRVAVLLNISEDHLDRHGSFEAYVAAKARIFAAQGPDDFAVINGADPTCAALGQNLRSVCKRFGGPPGLADAWLEGTTACLALGRDSTRFELAGSPSAALPGDDVLAALLCVSLLGAPLDRAARGLATFEALPHRLETVAERGGTRWIDDSKATNPGAAVAAMRATPPPLIWIAGGRDKGLSFEALAREAAERVRVALLYGEAGPKLAAALSGRVDCACFPDLDRAVRRAGDLARPGDTVLLAPACASFDQFRSFEERGERFRQAVASLEGES